MVDIKNVVTKQMEYAIPRMLAQLCRDPESPLYGSFDRNHWHYKIRDFSSMVLHQGVILLDLIVQERIVLGEGNIDLELVRSWRDGCLRFWISQQHHSGGFDEYYPNESGFPATAFSLYATVIVARHSNLSESLALAMGRAVGYLLKYPELGASNQEAVALSACTMAANLGAVVDDDTLAHRWDQFFERQESEGWFEEYGGADTGYLSVTCDALWDYHSISKDKRALLALDAASGFIHSLQGPGGEIPGMINSRNTNYIVPYGLAKFGKKSRTASAVVKCSLERINCSEHFVHSVDDRYSVHYVYVSLLRSLSALGELTKPSEAYSRAQWYGGAGIFVDHRSEYSLYVAAKKGGVIIKRSANGIEEGDYGWRAEYRGQLVATHWQSPESTIVFTKGRGTFNIKIDTPIRKQKYFVPSPMKHMTLRISALLFGRYLMSFLKTFLIFRGKSKRLLFSRVIKIDDKFVSIQDHLSPANFANLRRAPMYSMRHVSSAGSFTIGELRGVEKTSKSLKSVMNY